MESKIKENLGYSIAVALFLKALVAGVSISDCAALLVVLGYLTALKVIDYKYPKRADLFSEVYELKTQIDELNKKLDENQRQVTALSFERGLR